jgi:glycosyltransferase involved in cell wall biosynthesis
VIPPGVDLERFTARRATPDGVPRLLFVGGNFERKGGDLVLDVFRKHLKGRCVLDLVTRDPVASEDGVNVYRDLNADSPKLAALYEGAYAFVLPTRADCFSIASMEAMAKGLPVIVTGVGGIPEIVEQGESGFLLERAAGEPLRVALEQLLADAGLARRMGERGRQIVEARFDAKKTALDIVRKLEGLVRGAVN